MDIKQNDFSWYFFSCITKDALHIFKRNQIVMSGLKTETKARSGGPFRHGTDP